MTGEDGAGGICLPKRKNGRRKNKTGGERTLKALMGISRRRSETTPPDRRHPVYPGRICLTNAIRWRSPVPRPTTGSVAPGQMHLPPFAMFQSA